MQPVDDLRHGRSEHGPERQSGLPVLVYVVIVVIAVVIIVVIVLRRRRKQKAKKNDIDEGLGHVRRQG